MWKEMENLLELYFLPSFAPFSCVSRHPNAPHSHHIYVLLVIWIFEWIKIILNKVTATVPRTEARARNAGRGRSHKDANESWHPRWSTIFLHILWFYYMMWANKCLRDGMAVADEESRKSHIAVSWNEK